MKKLRLLNFNLAENYILNRVSGEEIQDMIMEYNPNIVSIQNINSANRKKLERLGEMYHLFASSTSGSGEMTITKRKEIRYNERALSLNSDTEKQLLSMPEENKKYNYQQTVIGYQRDYLAIINAKLNNTIMSHVSAKQLTELKKMISRFQEDESYKTKYQIITAEYENARDFDIFYLTHDLTDILRKEKSKEHIIISDSLGVARIKRQKLKTKGYKESTATIVELQKKN